MTAEAPSNPDYDPTKVMFNGAAIALVTNLTNGIQAALTAEIKAAEERQNRRLEEAVKALTGDVDALELWRDDMESARLVRQGQMSVITGILRFIAHHERAILGIGMFVLAAVVALLGLDIRVGP